MEAMLMLFLGNSQILSKYGHIISDMVSLRRSLFDQDSILQAWSHGMKINVRGPF
jgi:hypothetical protein